MKSFRRTAFSFLAIPILGLLSCEENQSTSNSEHMASEEDYEKMKSELANLEQGAENFREEVANALNQQAINDMTPEELEAVRNSGIEVPEGVELPPEE